MIGVRALVAGVESMGVERARLLAEAGFDVTLLDSGPASMPGEDYILPEEDATIIAEATAAPVPQ